MPNIQLETGNTIYLSAYEFYFRLDEKDLDLFFQSCLADNLGVYIDNPFSNRRFERKIEEDLEETDENYE